jgi:hypothetical protein
MAGMGAKSACLVRMLACMTALSVACTSSSPASTIPDSSPGYQVPVCEPNTAAKCVGKGGCSGGMLCGQDGTYGECACDGDAGMAPDSAIPDSTILDVAPADTVVDSAGGADVSTDISAVDAKAETGGPDS